MSTNIVIFAQPDNRLMAKIGICTQYCIEAGYEAIAVVRGTWEEAMDYITAGEAEVILAAEDDDLPPDRTPRVEVVSQIRENDARNLYRSGRNERGDVDDNRRRRPRPLA